MLGSTEFDVETATNDVVVSIVSSGAATNDAKSGDNSSSYTIPSTSQGGFGIKSSKKVVIDSPTEISEKRNSTITSPNLTPRKPPITPNEFIRRRVSLSRSAFSKPKSRLIEPPYPSDATMVEERSPVITSNSPGVGVGTPKTPVPTMVEERSPVITSNSPGVGVGTPKTPVIPITPTQGDDEEEDEDVYKSTQLQKCQRRYRVLVILEWLVFIGLISVLVSSLTIPRLEKTSLWTLALWKWCVLVIVIFCGRLVTEWFVKVLVFLVEQNFLFKKKVLYFVYGMKRSVQIFVWFFFVLLAWILLFSHGTRRSRRTTTVLHHITMAIAGCLVGSGIWLLKTLLTKTIALSFHVNRFFDRIQESLFQQYVLQTLSGLPLMEIAENVGKSNVTSGQLSFERMSRSEGVKKEEVIDVEKLHKMRQEKVSAGTMKGLINIIRRTKLSTISESLRFDEDDDKGEQTKEITSEWEAKIAAENIFKNVAKHGHRYIEEEDLLRFMKLAEVHQVFPLFEGAAETGKVKKSALKKWVVNAYLERKSLAHSLNDTKTAVEELNKILSAVVSIVIIIVWNLMMGFLTTKILVFITSQLLLVVFIFGNSVKMVFEAIIFVFIMHPFDVGDRCVIDGVQMIVEEMNILTTIFLRYDNEKIIYPNSVLAIKPISNFYRSPEMSDSVEFAVGFSTTAETIAALKARIKVYVESKPQHWRPNHSVQVKEILDMNKIKMAVYVNHTINFQNMGERSSRRSDFILELKKIFEDLEIKYNLLPQDVHVSYVGSPASTSVSHQ